MYSYSSSQIIIANHLVGQIVPFQQMKTLSYSLGDPVRPIWQKASLGDDNGDDDDNVIIQVGSEEEEGWWLEIIEALIIEGEVILL